jgi:hypothetical protein
MNHFPRFPKMQRTRGKKVQGISCEATIEAPTNIRAIEQD